ncbi:hypothetical protein HDV05_002332 [Chytridiales sp. JEL 0842]|nr:hypothetical protein HDV05_002332 [Chytridiales sp. JEL 0842]
MTSTAIVYFFLLLSLLGITHAHPLDKERLPPSSPFDLAPLINTTTTFTAVPHPSQPNNIPIQLRAYSYTPTTQFLNGSIWVQNIAYYKSIQVVYALGGPSPDATWNDEVQYIDASFVNMTGLNNYEVWSFAGKTKEALKTGAKMYLRYNVARRTYYDNNNYKNYPIGIPNN